MREHIPNCTAVNKSCSTHTHTDNIHRQTITTAEKWSVNIFYLVLFQVFSAVLKALIAIWMKMLHIIHTKRGFQFIRTLFFWNARTRSQCCKKKCIDPFSTLNFLLLLLFLPLLLCGVSMCAGCLVSSAAPLHSLFAPGNLNKLYVERVNWNQVYFFS